MTKKAHMTRRQLLAKKVSQATKLVKEANDRDGHLDKLPEFCSFKTKDDADVKISCHRVKDLPQETVEWIVDLMERNMKKYYEQSAWGWKPEEKRAELTEDSAWYLIASSGDKHIGFSHFRFDLDDQIEVLYCYELQLEEMDRRKGLGTFMMRALEHMAQNNKMQKIVLTALKCNPAATEFFMKQGFKRDITDPPASEGVDYIILSKPCISVKNSNSQAIHKKK